MPETDLVRIRRWAESRVPAHVRDKIWIELDVDARSVTVVECRPPRNPERRGPEPTRFPVAKLRYVMVRKEWELFWRDRDERFRRYHPMPAAAHVETLLAEIDADPTCLFWG